MSILYLHLHHILNLKRTAVHPQNTPSERKMFLHDCISLANLTSTWTTWSLRLRNREEEE